MAGVVNFRSQNEHPSENAADRHYAETNREDWAISELAQKGINSTAHTRRARSGGPPHRLQHVQRRRDRGRCISESRWLDRPVRAELGECPSDLLRELEGRLLQLHSAFLIGSYLRM